MRLNRRERRNASSAKNARRLGELTDEQIKRGARAMVRAVLDELSVIHSARRYNVKLVVDGVYTVAEWTGMPMPPDSGSALTLRVTRGRDTTSSLLLAIASAFRKIQEPRDFTEATYAPPFEALELRIELVLDPMKPGGTT